MCTKCCTIMPLAEFEVLAAAGGKPAATAHCKCSSCGVIGQLRRARTLDGSNLRMTSFFHAYTANLQKAGSEVEVHSQECDHGDRLRCPVKSDDRSCRDDDFVVENRRQRDGCEERKTPALLKTNAGSSLNNTLSSNWGDPTGSSAPVWIASISKARNSGLATRHPKSTVVKAITRFDPTANLSSKTRPGNAVVY